MALGIRGFSPWLHDPIRHGDGNMADRKQQEKKWARDKLDLRTHGFPQFQDLSK